MKPALQIVPAPKNPEGEVKTVTRVLTFPVDKKLVKNSILQMMKRI